MSLKKLTTLSRMAISKAQQATGQIPPDLANRVTALESADQAFDTRVQAIEDFIATGYNGSIVVITGVNFTTQSTTTKTITIADGIITGVA